MDYHKSEAQAESKQERYALAIKDGAIDKKQERQE
jgi:hypothetical protein